MNEIGSRILDILRALGYPVARIFYDGQEDTYFVFRLIKALPFNYSDDCYISMVYTFNVCLYTRNSNYEDLIQTAGEALKQEGFTIVSFDEEEYEKESGFYKIPLTITGMEE